MRVIFLSFPIVLACSSTNKRPAPTEGVEDTAYTEALGHTDTAETTTEDHPEDSGRSNDTGEDIIPVETVEIVDITIDVPPRCSVRGGSDHMDRPPRHGAVGQRGESLGPWVQSTAVTNAHSDLA